MNMTRSQLVAASLLAGQAMCGYALVQPDFVLPPIAKFIVGILNVGIGALLLVLRIQPAGPVLQVPGGGGPVTGGKS